MDPSQHPTPEKEYERYCEHDNDPTDPGYRNFLSKLAIPLLEKLAPASKGLDYGCGPGPALANMLEEFGYRMSVFDPFFYQDTTVLQQNYDFVTCTEVVEHFHNPFSEFVYLDGLLRAGGWLAVMTSFLTQDARFANWRYRRDPTHVIFYAQETFHVLADKLGSYCEIPYKDVVLMQKPVKAPDTNKFQSLFFCP
uniref:Methyltransferase type 12 n=1 Tax=uncultured organism TaxID=155900 RepID=M1P2N0_9ZZZZ|nr:methyltransferase type 12 [uncultured organism]